MNKTKYTHHIIHIYIYYQLRIASCRCFFFWNRWIAPEVSPRGAAPLCDVWSQGLCLGYLECQRCQGNGTGRSDSAGSLVFICHGSCEQSNLEEHFMMLHYFSHSVHVTATDVLLYGSIYNHFASISSISNLHGEWASCWT